MIRQSLTGMALLAALAGCNGGEEGGTEINDQGAQESGTESPMLDVAPGVVESGTRGNGMDSALTGRSDSASAATIGTVGGGGGGGAGGGAAGGTTPPAGGGN